MQTQKLKDKLKREELEPQLFFPGVCIDNVEYKSLQALKGLFSDDLQPEAEK